MEMGRSTNVAEKPSEGIRMDRNFEADEPLVDERFRDIRLTRRDVLKVSGLGLIAAACQAVVPSGSPVGASSSAGPLPSASSAASAAVEPSVNPGKVTVLIPDFATGRFDGAYAAGETGEQMYGKLVSGAVIASDPDGKMIPGMASAWSVSEDGTTWTFTFREGIKFHDGKDVTMDDILWSFQHAFGPGAADAVVDDGSSRVALLKPDISVNGRDLIVKTSAPDPILTPLLFEGKSGWTSIMPKRAELQNPDDIAAYDLAPIGTGVMKVTEIVPGSKMTFERFADYFYQPQNGLPEDRRVKFQQLVMNQVPERSTRVAALLSGEADIAPVSLEDRSAIEGAGGHLVFAKEGAFLQAIIYGTMHTKYPWHDARVRQALNYATNKELLRDQILGGSDAFEIKGFWTFTPGTQGYSSAINPLPFDPDKARQLLADAGYPGGAGFREIVMNIQEDDTVVGVSDAAQVVAQGWKTELGINVKLQQADSSLIKKRRNSGDLNASGEFLWRTNGTRNDPTSKLLELVGDPNEPIVLLHDPVLHDEAVIAAETVDITQRETRLRDIFVKLHDQSPVIDIGFYNTVWGTGRRISDWHPLPLSQAVSALHTINLVG
jgi:peptide/nickel transport system substrate-binding protein